MEDSGLLELIQLICPGSTTASHTLNGGCFDKANRAHLLIHCRCSHLQYQHVMKHTFNNEEVAEMRAYMEKVVNEKMGARQSADIMTLFQTRSPATAEKARI